MLGFVLSQKVQIVCMRGSRKLRQGVLTNIFNHQGISQRAVRASLEKQLDPGVSIADRGGSVPLFLRTDIATCDVPGGQATCPLSSGSVHVLGNSSLLTPI